MLKAPLATSTPSCTLRATAPSTARSTLAVKLPRLVAFNAALAALRSMPLLVKVLQSSLVSSAVPLP